MYTRSFLRGTRFARYNNDYRVFARSYAEAYCHLTFLAKILFRNHGLNLQPQKTEILEACAFRDRWLPSPEEREFISLQERFRGPVNQLDLSSEYEKTE